MVFATPRVKSNSKGKTKVTGLQVQNSAYGLALPVVYLGPWSVLLILVLLPWMLVRRARRQR